MARAYYEKLSNEVKRKIQNREYSRAQLKELYRQICQKRENNQKGFKRAVVIVMGIMILIIAMTLMSAEKMPNINMNAKLFSMLVVVIGCVVALVIVKFRNVDLVYNQFKYLVKKHYPEYENMFFNEM